MHFKVLFLDVIVLTGVISIAHAFCPGPCLLPGECKANGGLILGMCGMEKYCCEYTTGMQLSGSCGTSMPGTQVSYFKSPNYPMFSSGNLICVFDLELSPPTVGIRVDFLDVQMDYVPNDPVGLYDSPNPACDSDMLFIKGFSDWTPDPRCGNLTSYSILVEREEGQRFLSLVFVMSSSEYKWHLRLTQIYGMQLDRLEEIFKNSVTSSVNNNALAQGNLANDWYQLQHFGMMRPIPPMHLPSFMHQYRIQSTANELKVSPRILGGTDAQPESIPWQVSIQTVDKIPSTFCGEETNTTVHVCGGSIIDDYTILTAAHCFFSPSKYPHPILGVEELQVVVGEHDLCKNDEVAHTAAYRLASIVLFYNYLSTDIVNDLALVRTTERIMFNKAVQPISIANPNLKVSDLKPMLSGWGSLGVEDNSTFPPVLQMTSDIAILPEAECVKSQKEYLAYGKRKLSGKYFGVFNNGICTKGKDAVAQIQAGFGDSGGPLAVFDPGSNQYILVGIVSHKRPEVDYSTANNQSFNLNYFAKVSAYRNWIMLGLV